MFTGYREAFGFTSSKFPRALSPRRSERKEEFSLSGRHRVPLNKKRNTRTRSGTHQRGQDKATGRGNGEKSTGGPRTFAGCRASSFARRHYAPRESRRVVRFARSSIYSDGSAYWRFSRGVSPPSTSPSIIIRTTPTFHASSAVRRRDKMWKLDAIRTATNSTRFPTQTWLDPLSVQTRNPRIKELGFPARPMQLRFRAPDSIREHARRELENSERTA